MMTIPYTPGRPAVTLPREGWSDWLSRAQRVMTYRFGHYDNTTDRYLGELHPVKGAQLQHTTGQAVPRRLTMTLTSGEAPSFDPITSRVRVTAVMGDGREYQLGGRYMAADDTRGHTSTGSPAALALVDELQVVAQGMERGFTARLASSSAPELGQNAGLMAGRFLDRYALFNPGIGEGAHAAGPLPEHGYRIPVAIEPTTYLSAGSWSAGSAGTQVLQDLSTAGDYWSPWIDNTGVLRMIRSFDPAARVPGIDWDTTPAVIRDSPALTTDLIRAPNRYVVVNNSAGAGDRPIVGTYDVPSSAPWSAARRGYVIPEVTTMQVASIAQATAIARNLAQRQQVYVRAQVTTPPDPRHDSYDVVLWDGHLWLETGWSLTLTAGAAMTHNLRRAYA